MPKKSKSKNGKKSKRKMVNRPPRRALAEPNIYSFKRTFSNIQELSANNDYWTSSGNNLAKAWAFNLESMGSETEFQGLFKYYRLKGARVRMYFSNTNSAATSNENPAVSPSVPNCQILVSIDRNLDGDSTAVADEELYLQSQTTKRVLALRTDGKPLDFYMPLRQKDFVGAGIVSGVQQLKPTLSKPQWCSTQNASDISHFGYNTLFQRVDGAGFTVGMTNAQSVKILTTLYFECKKVE